MLVASLISVAKAQSPPPTHLSWCSNAQQYLTVNGSVKHSVTFHICMDSDLSHLRWSANITGHPQRFNGTTRFDLTPNASAPGGFSCVSKYFGKASIHMMPWSMVQIDPNAAFNRTEQQVDGFAHVNVWSVYRPARTAPVHIQAQTMEWHIENTSVTPSKEFLRSTCIQRAFPPSPPGLMQAGTRDFSHDYVTPAPAGMFDPPAGVVCQAAPGHRPMVPDDHCKPKCPAGSLCCRAPGTDPPGYCLTVHSCNQTFSSPAAFFAQERAGDGAWTPSALLKERFYGEGDVDGLRDAAAAAAQMQSSLFGDANGVAAPLPTRSDATAVLPPTIQH